MLDELPRLVIWAVQNCLSPGIGSQSFPKIHLVNTMGLKKDKKEVANPTTKPQQQSAPRPNSDSAPRPNSDAYQDPIGNHRELFPTPRIILFQIKRCLEFFSTIPCYIF